MSKNRYILTIIKRINRDRELHDKNLICLFRLCFGKTFHSDMSSHWMCKGVMIVESCIRVEVVFTLLYSLAD